MSSANENGFKQPNEVAAAAYAAEANEGAALGQSMSLNGAFASLKADGHNRSKAIKATGLLFGWLAAFVLLISALSTCCLHPPQPFAYMLITDDICDVPISALIDEEQVCWKVGSLSICLPRSCEEQIVASQSCGHCVACGTFVLQRQNLDEIHALDFVPHVVCRAPLQRPCF